LSTFAEIKTTKLDPASDSEPAEFIKRNAGDGAIEAHVIGGTIVVTPSGTQDVNVVEIGGNAVTTTIPVSGTVTATGPLTDVQLRATPVPISGTVTATPTGTQDVNLVSTITVPVSGPLTDTQLRATPVPVSGTVAVSAVSGTVAVTQSTSPWVTNDPGLPNALGQANMAGSTSVAIASDQSAIPVSGSVTVSGTVTANLGTIDGAATAVAQTDGSQKTQIVDDDGTVIGATEILAKDYLNVAIVQDIELSPTNSSTANLAAGATFTGTSCTTLGVAAIQISLFADQNCTIRVEQAQEEPGVNWDVFNTWNYTASSGSDDAARTIQATGSSFRIRVTNNGGSPTTQFRLLSVVTPYADALPRGLSELGNLKVSLEELNNTDISTGNGTADSGTQRVVIASDNSPVPTSVSSLPLPSGASTLAAQGTGNASLSSIDGKLSGTLTVSGTVNPTTPSVVQAFVTTVATAGTRVQLASHAVIAGILQAPSTNTGLIYVGDSTVSSTVYGAELQAGQATGIAINNTNAIWIDASVNGSKCAFLGS